MFWCHFFSPIRGKKEAAWISVPFFSNAQVDVPVCWEGMLQVGGHVIELYIEVQGSMVSYAMIKKTADFLWLT